MAIHTKYGTKVLSIEWLNEGDGETGVIVETERGNPQARWFRAEDLRADGGIDEIVASAKTIRNPGGWWATASKS